MGPPLALAMMLNRFTAGPNGNQVSSPLGSHRCFVGRAGHGIEADWPKAADGLHSGHLDYALHSARSSLSMGLTRW